MSKQGETERRLRRKTPGERRRLVRLWRWMARPTHTDHVGNHALPGRGEFAVGGRRRNKTSRQGALTLTPHSTGSGPAIWETGVREDH